MHFRNMYIPRYLGITISQYTYGHERFCFSFNHRDGKRLCTGTAGLPIRWTLGRRWDDVITGSDFKSETIFGFLSQNYTGQYMYLIFLVKPKNGLVWPVFACRLKKVFSRGFFVRASKIGLNNWDELTNSESDAHYERKSSSLNALFENNRRIDVSC